MNVILGIKQTKSLGELWTRKLNEEEKKPERTVKVRWIIEGHWRSDVHNNHLRSCETENLWMHRELQRSVDDTDALIFCEEQFFKVNNRIGIYYLWVLSLITKAVPINAKRITNITKYSTTDLLKIAFLLIWFSRSDPEKRITHETVKYTIEIVNKRMHPEKGEEWKSQVLSADLTGKQRADATRIE